MFAPVVGRLPLGHLWWLWRRLANERPHRFGGQVRINTFFPPYPSLAFRRFRDGLVQRRRVPFSVYVAATHACPFKCPHCSVAGREAKELSTSQLLDVIEQVKSLGTATLGITGGEPLLRGDLERLLAAAGPEMVTILFTGGAGLDRRRAEMLAAANVACVTVGIESADPGEHDAVRGCSGSFAQARAAVEACRGAGLYSAVSTIGTRQRLADGSIERMYELACDWGVGEFRLLAPVATGRWAGCGSAMLSQAERSALADFHVRHNRDRQPGPAVASFAYLESDAMFGCGAGYHHLFIDAGGNVCPCDLTPLAFGSVMDEPLSEIWRRMAKWFSRPRCGCLMQPLAGEVDRLLSGGGLQLPLPQPVAESLCQPGCGPLPQGYRRIIKA